MSSSPDDSRGSIAAEPERWTPRESVLLRGASAAQAAPYRGSGAVPVQWAQAAPGAAVRALEGAAAPVAEEVRDTVLTVATTLVEDLLGRELALADSPGLDAVRRAMTLCPDDAPVVVRLHPDDLAEVPPEALAE